MKSRVGLAGVVVGAALLRVGLLDVPLERDEGEYAYTAQLLLNGVPPYAEAYNMKLPGIYVAYAAILAVLGEAPRDIHLGLLLLNAATTVLVFLIGRRLFDDWVGLAGSAVFALLSLSWSVQGLWANAEAFVLPFVLAGLWATLRALETDRRSWFAVAGLLLGVGFLMKQHGVFFIGAAAACVVFDSAWASTVDRRRSLGRLGILIAAASSPYAVTCLVLLSFGVFDAFWFWTFEYARAYSGIIPLSEGPSRLWRAWIDVSAGGLGLWLIAFLGLGSIVWFRGSRRVVVLLGLFTAASFTALLPGLYFRPHYFVLVLPVVGLLAGVGARAAGDLLESVGVANARRWAPLMLLLLGLGQALWAQKAVLFELEPFEVTRSVYGLSPFPESLVAADFLRSNSEPEDRIAILGSEPQIPFYAGRRKASGYLYVYPLMEGHDFAEAMQAGMIREIEESRPRFLVFVNVPSSWQRGPHSRTELLEWLDHYIRKFRLVGRVLIEPDGSRLIEQNQLSQASSCLENCLEIFERISTH